MKFQADRSGEDLLAQRLVGRAISLAEKSEVHGKRLGGLQHAVDIPFPRRASSRIGAVGGAGAAAKHGGDAAGHRVLDLLRTNEMNVGVDAARGYNAAFPGDHLCRRADGHGDPILNQRIPRMADSDDAASLDADVRLDNSVGGIENQSIGDDQVE